MQAFTVRKRSRLASRVRFLVLVFVGVELALLALTLVGLQLLATSRGFGEALRSWSVARQESVAHLVHYARSGDAEDLARFDAAISRVLSQRRVRIELAERHPDLEVVRDGFLVAGNHPDDVDDIVRVAGWARWMPRLEDLLSEWQRADAYVTQLLGVARALEEGHSADGELDVEAYLPLIERSDEQLRRTGVEFGKILGESVRSVRRRLVSLITLAGVVLLAGGCCVGLVFARRLEETERQRLGAELRYQALVASRTVGIWQLSLDGRVEFANRALLSMLGLEGRELEGDPGACLSAADLETLRSVQVDAARGRARSYELEVVPRGGGPARRLLVSSSPLTAESGAIEGSIGTCIDISERWRAERALRASETWQRLVLEQLPATVWTTDLKLRYTTALGRGGHSPAGVSGESVYDVFGTRDPEAVPIAAHLRALAGESVSFEEHWSGRTFQSRVEPLQDDEGRITGTVGMSLDITERKNIEARLAYLASRDPLTDLFNRRRFEEELALFLARAERTGEGGALLWCDLDDFKDINDRFGHRTGDDLLLSVATSFRGQMGGGETLARVGGDEFGILLPGADVEKARSLADGLLRAIRRRHPRKGESVGTTASIGVVVYPDHGRTSEQLLTHADVAMYRAKRAGRDRYEVFDVEQALTAVR